MDDAIAAQVRTSADEVTPAAPQPPPPPHRRPRVREVSSRFMQSPAVSTPAPPETNSRQQQRSKSVQRRRQDQPEPFSCADMNVPDSIQRSETQMGLSYRSKSAVMSLVQRKQQQQRACAVKLLKENGPKATPSSRPDTPIVGATERAAMTSSKFRHGTENLARSTFANGAVTAAAKLLQSSGMSLSAPQPSIPDSNSRDGKSDNQDFTPKIPTFSGPDSSTSTSPISSVLNSKTRSLPDLRSSMPEVDSLSDRLLEERSCAIGDVTGCNSSKFSSSTCSRSLNLSSSSSEHSSIFHTLKARENRSLFLHTPFTSYSAKIGNLCLPPLPGSKFGADPKRGKKVFNHQEEVHYLKLLHNCYLQWRFANARAEASMHTQRRETEKKLYSLGVKISDLRDVVKRKRVEVALLHQTETLDTLLDAQMPHLDEWDTLEEEYSSSLSGVIHALVNASLQLPVSGNVQVDLKAMGEALNSALNLAETIGLHVQTLIPKAEEMDALMSDLARVIGGERALMEDCRHLLSNAYTIQVEECSLRGHLIQVRQIDRVQPQE
ncbi:protein ENDOSPERM DEFECTIVE 1-like [Diospyros lotus]|uniref:protein ENDOSPERM DEFECTIVE 1-like n=1 Tax=Diospyros lotus TaxID=55363 RepID=UPI0022504D33|nr:protein ENDOSPERM DEFECTIVE 1-like [Diospyros lotus]